MEAYTSIIYILIVSMNLNLFFFLTLSNLYFGLKLRLTNDLEKYFYQIFFPKSLLFFLMTKHPIDRL